MNTSDTTTASAQPKNARTFYFDTGVKPHLHNPPVKPSKGEILSPNGVVIIPFVCENVPKGSAFRFACSDPNLPEAKYSIVRPIISGGLLSKYAYFSK